MKFLKKIGHALKRAFCAVGRWMKKHKILTVLLVLVIGVGTFFGVRLIQSKTAASASTTYSFIRTTTLTKGNLDDSVSCTGTVGSANTSTVSYSSGSGVAVPKIKTVNVAVGDTVAVGDVIVTLDSSDIQDSITKAKESLADAIADAQDKYDTAVTDYNTAESTATAYETTFNTAASTLSAATTNYNSAVTNVASFQSAYNSAAAAQEAAGRDSNDKLVSYNTAVANYNTAVANLAANSQDAGLIAAKDAAEAAMNSAQAALTGAQAAYQNATAAVQSAQTSLNNAKSACNYDSYEKAYSSAQTAYTQARQTLDQYEKTVTTCASTVTQTKKNLENASTSDTLESLQESLAACSLTAETAGKVTGLTASVGGTPSGTIATIQDTSSLKVSITIEEADINAVSLGMNCYITSDATDGTISGTLTQIDPVAGQSGSFGAQVTVTGDSTGLLIGMNATVEIVKSSTSDCFMVPIDAVGNDNGTSFVYRKTGGEGTNLTFEKVTVTTGASNDYYIEISSDELAEGDVIRSSADLTQGVEETTTSSSGFDLSGLLGGQMSGQASGGMGAGGGAMPSGGGSGGGPSGNGGGPGNMG